MKPLVVGASFRSAPLEVRERLSVTREALPEALHRMAAALGQGVIVATCNRAEFYTLAQDRRAAAQVVRFLGSTFGVPAEALAAGLYQYEGEGAARHLFRVVSGLDSMVLGENEVLGQVRDAYSAATAARTVRGPLSRLFHQAFRVGRRVRRDTGLSRNALSVSGLCVHLVRRALGTLEGATVAVVGAGEAGKLTAQALRHAGAAQVVVTNRTLERAAELAEEVGGRVEPFDGLEEVVAEADVVISTTGSPGYVLGRDMVRRALIARRERAGERPLVLVDIAVPRDVDPAVRALPGLALFDLDDLDSVAEANRLERRREAARAEAIVEEEVAAFAAWWRSLEVVPTVAALRRQAEAIRQREVARSLRRLKGLTPEQQQALDALTRAMVKKLLHHPTQLLKERRDTVYLEAVRELFHLDEDAP